MSTSNKAGQSSKDTPSRTENTGQASRSAHNLHWPSFPIPPSDVGLGSITLKPVVAIRRSLLLRWLLIVGRRGIGLRWRRSPIRHRWRLLPIQCGGRRLVGLSRLGTERRLPVGRRGRDQAAAIPTAAERAQGTTSEAGRVPTLIGRRSILGGELTSVRGPRVAATASGPTGFPRVDVDICLLDEAHESSPVKSLAVVMSSRGNDIE